MKHLREFIIVLLIVATAAFFRLYKLDTFPPGLYPDEAMNGNNALQAIDTGDYKIFYPENNGREGLFISIQSLSVRTFGNTPFALRVVSAIFGTLTILGLYFLTRKLFNWQVASIASFLMAISFWHVTFSRIGFRAIMAPLLIVWGAYFFWKGLGSTRMKDFAISAVFWGLGFYTYISFRIMPLVLLISLAAYWHAIKKDFGHDRYLHTRNRVIQGMAAFMLVAIAVVLPLMYHFLLHPEDFMGRLNDVSIFAQDNPIKILAMNTAKTLGMFNFIGDHNWRHNIAGRPILYLPIGIFFILGFFKSLLRLEKSRRLHGHFSAPHVFLLSWFGLGLLPVVMSTEGIPHALRAIVTVPVVYIFAAEGMWWIFEWTKEHYHHSHDMAIGGTLAVFLFAMGLNEYKTYFHDWAPHEAVRAEFNQNYVDVANRVNALPRSRPVYIAVNRDTGVWEYGYPIPAQTVMFLTDTSTRQKQEAKNIFYLTPEQYAKKQYPPNALVIPLEAKK